MSKILIIEDDKIVGAIYQNKFRSEGFVVELAQDGETGIAKLGGFQPDLVILDLTLPKMNGVQVIQQIRGPLNLPDLPIVVFSNAYLANLVQEAWKAGANHCLTKSTCNPKQLLEVVNRTLQQTAPQSVAPQTVLVQPAMLQPVVPSPRSGAGDTEASVQAELRRNFWESSPEMIGSLRLQVHNLGRTGADPIRLALLSKLYRTVHSLTSNAAVAGLSQMAQVAEAFEAFLKELDQKPRNFNASTLRTIAHTIDFLAGLQDCGNLLEHELGAHQILVVDDEVISRRAVVCALQRAHLSALCVEDPVAALRMAVNNRFDLVFLDVDMPEMSGFELCLKLRALPQHAGTPVVFVTSLNDFESRARSTLSGGTDLIAKPFLFMELAVKALTYLLQGRLSLRKAA